MLQEKFLKRFLNIILISMQLFGFWPYVFDSNERLFRPSKLIYVYSIVVMIGINAAYFIYFRNLYTFSMTIFKSEGARITILYGVASSSLITILIYLIQLAKLAELNDIFVKIKCLMQKLNRTIEMDGMSYTKELLLFTIKTFGLGLLGVYLSSTKLKSDPLSLFFGYIIPDLIITVMANNFYGVLLIILVYLKRTNQVIYNVTHTAIELEGSNKTHLEKIESLCRLSDRLNELTTCQYQLCDLTRELCGIFSFHVTAWIIHRVSILLVQLFLIYVLFVLIMFRSDKERLDSALVTVLQLFINIVEFAFLAKACNDVNNEIRKPGLILFNPTLMSTKSDDRYIKSLEMLSLQTIQFKFNISGCSMYNIDYALFYSILTFVVATWLILIQYEIATLQKTLKH